jgi:hypothetical protein
LKLRPIIEILAVRIDPELVNDFRYQDARSSCFGRHRGDPFDIRQIASDLRLNQHRLLLAGQSLGAQEHVSVAVEPRTIAGSWLSSAHVCLLLHASTILRAYIHECLL